METALKDIFFKFKIYSPKVGRGKGAKLGKQSEIC